MSCENSRRIMIVEDDDSLRHILALRFRNGGYEVLEAANAADALTASGVSDFDVVVTDVHLPGISGIELARTLHHQVPAVPVVFVSGDADAEVIREALETKSSAAYMIKPFQLCELDTVVELVLKHSQAFTGPALSAPAAPRFRNRIAHLFDDNGDFRTMLVLLVALATAVTAGILRT